MFDLFDCATMCLVIGDRIARDFSRCTVVPIEVDHSYNRFDIPGRDRAVSCSLCWVTYCVYFYFFSLLQI